MLQQGQRKRKNRSITDVGAWRRQAHNNRFRGLLGFAAVRLRIVFVIAFLGKRRAFGCSGCRFQPWLVVAINRRRRRIREIGRVFSAGSDYGMVGVSQRLPDCRVQRQVRGRFRWTPRGGDGATK